MILKGSYRMINYFEWAWKKNILQSIKSYDTKKTIFEEFKLIFELSLKIVKKRWTSSKKTKSF